MTFHRKLDAVAARAMMVMAALSGLLVFLIAAGLLWRSKPILSSIPLNELLFSSAWKPEMGKFGFWPYILGTVYVTLVAVGLAIPLCLLVSIYLSEYAYRRVREMLLPLIDLLAGIPSVVYGVWGVLVVVPFIQDRLGPWMGNDETGGYCVLAGGVVLAIMIFPVIINVTVEVFRSVPAEMRTAALALGATKWQVVKNVVLRKALPGIVAACVLGLSRAFGETMAVLMVVGNVAMVPHSPFDPAYPLPALIANNYGEMMSIPMYDSALLFAALILMVVVVGFNLLARVILVHIEKKTQ